MASGDVGVVGRVDQGGQFPGAPAVAQGREGHGRPDGGVGVLAAVLAHAGHVALDVAGVQLRLVEGRIEQLDQAVLAAHQALVHRLHGQARALGVARPGQHRPALRDRIDPAFAVVRRAQRRAVVEPGAAIPVAVPGVAFEVLAQAHALGRADLGEGADRPCRRASAPNWRSTSYRKKPSQTLSPLPWMPTRFMPSFQSPEPISGRPWAPTRPSPRRMARTQCR